MSTEALIELSGPNGSTEQVLDQKIYLLFIDEQIEFSISNGPVKLENSDGIITVKIQDDVEEAMFSGHPLRKGAIYFLENEDSITFGDYTIKLKTSEKAAEISSEFEESTDHELDMLELEVNEDATVVAPMPKPLQREDKAEPENDDLILEVEQLISKDDDKSEDEPRLYEIPDAPTEQDEATHGGFSLDNDSPTRTSIAVHELLQTHNEDNDNIPIEAKKAAKAKEKAKREELGKLRKKNKANPKKKKSQADKDLDLDGAHRFKMTEKKQGTKIDKKESTTFFVPEDNLVGPIVRILGTLSTLVIAIFANKYVELEPIAPLAQHLEGLINQKLEFKELSPLPYSVYEIIVVFILIELLSRTLFSVSLPHFISGITNYGNLASSRIKALLKLPLDLISVVFPLGEVPVIFGKRSFKEVVTLSQTRYRSSFLKFFAPLVIIIFTVLFAYSKIALELVNVKEPAKMAFISNYKPKKAVAFSHLKTTKGIQERYYIDGGLEQKGHYIFVHRQDKHVLEYRGITKYTFEKIFQDFKDNAPFLDLTHPFLAQYFKDGHSNEKVRNDVLRIIKSGELTNFLLLDNALNFDPLYAIEGHSAFRRLGIKASQVMSATGFYRIYKYKGEYSSLFIGEDAIYTFNIAMSDKKALKALTQIHFAVNKSAPKTDFENGTSNYEQNVAPLIEGLDSTKIESMMKRYQRFTQKNLP